MTTSPTTYDAWQQAAWVNTNSNNDHYNPYRQDYQLVLPFYLNGTAGLAAQGVYMNLAREKTFRYPMRTFGRYIQITINSTSGTTAIRSISINDTEAQRATKAT